jgi:WD40 repeat protein
LFISHSSKDNDPAKRVRDLLRDQGWRDTFLDLDPEHGLAPGQRWQEELKKAGERCSAVIVLISPDWVASRWCLTEFLVASQLGKRIFPVLIAPTPFSELPVELTAHFQMADISRPEVEADGLNRLWIGLKRAGLDPKDFPWPPAGEVHRPPYRGLLTLEEADAAIFFGRDGEITRGLDTLRRMRGGQPERMLVILGASGSGKSSFLRAGLLARLRRDEENFLVLPIMRPGRAAMTGPTGLARAFGISDDFTREAIAASFAALRAPVVDRLARYARAGKQDPVVRPPTLILPIDQGEELFSAEQSEGAVACIVLAEAIAADNDLLVVATVRSDSFAALQGDTSLLAIPRLPFDLPALPLASFREVIEGPGRLAKPPIRFEETLSARLVSDLDQADALPLLAFTLERLVEDYGVDGMVELAEYRDGLGGLGGAIGGAAAAALAAAGKDSRLPRDPTAIEKLARAAFIPWLLKLEGADQAPKRRVAVRPELPAEAWPVVEHLVARRLLVSDRRHDGETTVEVSHEAVLRHWDLLSRWIGEEREALAQAEAVQRAAMDWRRAATAEDQDSLLLHRSERLAGAEKLLARPDFAKLIGPDGSAYLAACRLAETDRQKREREDQERRIKDAERIAEEQRKVAWRTRIGALVAFALMVAAGAAAVLAWQQRNAALATTGRLIGAEAQRGLAQTTTQDTSPAIAALAATGWRLGKTSDAWNAMQRVPLVTVLARIAHNGAVSAVAFSPDGKLLATASSDHTARIVSVADGHELARINHDGAVWAVAFSPDGKLLATASGDNTARIVAVEDGRELTRIRHDGQVNALAFSPDGKLLATASNDHTARIAAVEDGRELARVTHDGQVNALAFSPDGKLLATASDDHTARIVAVEDGRELARVTHDGWVRALAFSPNGNLLATASNDNTARIVAVEDGRELARVTHHGPVSAVVFSPDGKLLATGSRDNTARIVAVDGGREVAHVTRDEAVKALAFSPDGALLALASGETSVEEGGDLLIVAVRNGRELASVSHDRRVSAVAFSPNGKLVATASDDKMARIVAVEDGREFASVTHDGQVYAVAFSPDGKLLATASTDHTARIVSVADGHELARVSHDDEVNAVAFSPDGKLLATASNDKTARIVSVADGHELARINHDGVVWAVAFSPNGKLLATASKDKTARIVAVVDGRELARVLHDGPVNALAFSPDGELLATASDDHTARIVAVANGRELARVTHDGQVYAVAFSPDGKLLATGSADKTARIAAVADGRELARVNHEGVVRAVRFSPDGKLLATASRDNAVRIVAVENGRELARVALDRPAWSVVFSPDGELLATASDDQTARIVTVADGRELARVTLDGAVYDVAFGPDGELFATASADKTARIWSANLDDMLQELCAGPGRNLSHSEWRRYFGDLSWQPTCEGWINPPE